MCNGQHTQSNLAEQMPTGRTRWDAHWHHLPNMTEPDVCGGDAALCRITLTTCCVLKQHQQTQMLTDKFTTLLSAFRLPVHKKITARYTDVPDRNFHYLARTG